jgi:adenylylsulfate kinase-like enzyme
MLIAEDVFITTGFPEHTYVALAAGTKENELRDGLAQKNMIISVSGPSKSGKTTLCDRVFGKDKGLTHIYVTGDAITKVEDLWFEAYAKLQMTPTNHFLSLLKASVSKD